MNAEKEFKELFLAQCGRLNGYQIWSNTMIAIACSLSGAFDADGEMTDSREKEGRHCIDQIGNSEFIGKILAIITMALEENPNQDFLGKMFMELELSSNMTGQFFTPYHIAKMTAGLDIGSNVKKYLEKHEWTAIGDGACGAGATLIGAVNVLKEQGINYQENVCFVASDLDRVTALMCYIQLSLLGCAGYVVVTDSLSNPITGPILSPVELKNQEFWYMPMWHDPVWVLRRAYSLDELVRMVLNE